MSSEGSLHFQPSLYTHALLSWTAFLNLQNILFKKKKNVTALCMILFYGYFLYMSYYTVPETQNNMEQDW